MPEFYRHASVVHPHDSVTAQLVAWHVPKAWRFWLRQHQAVLVNGRYRFANLPVVPGDEISFRLQVPDVTDYLPEIHPLDVAYEDDGLLVVNKPAGVKPHPNQPGEGGTLMNWAAAYLAPNPAYITHRLDMATSGLTMIAKDPLTQSLLNQQLATKTLARTYVALVPAGIGAAGTIDAPIGLDPADRRKRMVRADGQRALTHWRRLAVADGVARVQLSLETGRTHQLRVHLASIGYPILGDPLYAADNPAPRLMLHASRLTWRKPFSDGLQKAECAVPF